MKIDVHTHLAGVGTAGSGCWISPRFRRRITFVLLRLLHRMTAKQMRETADQEWAARLAAQVRRSRLDRAVALGFDGAYTEHGELDRARSQMVIPPAWVFESCERHSELLPGPSLNPFRRDALQQLEECITRGAVLIKWLPIVQDFNPASPRIAEFYRLLAHARLPLLMHMGGERTFRTIAPQYNDVRLLRAPLDAGVPVICAHSGTRILFSRESDQLPTLRSMLAEYPHLWVDNAGLANPGRYAHLPRLADDPLIRERTLYGSDFPVPSNAVFFLRRLGARTVWRLERTGNPFDRDISLKLRLGYPLRMLTRAADLLPNLARWAAAA
jgi:uncharacterized protein